MARSPGGATGSNLWRTTAGYATGGAVFAVSVVLMLLPAASAVAVGGTTTIPVKLFGGTLSSDTTKGACGDAKVVKGPTWSKALSSFRGIVNSTAPTCKASTSPNEGEATASMDLQLDNYHFASSGNFVMNVSWVMSVSETWSMIPYSSCTLNYANPSSECMTYTEDTLYSYVFIDDLSNSSWGEYGYGYSFGSSIDVYLNSFAYVENLTYGNYSYGLTGPGAFTGTLNESSTLNLSGMSKINHHDKFDLTIYLEISTLAFAYETDAKTTGHASAGANIDANSGGHGIKLTSITLT